MSRFLFASTPIAAHSSNPLPIAARLVERGHHVDWYAGRAFHSRIAAVGARPIGFVEAHDLAELIVPSLKALASLDVLVAVTTCGADAAAVAAAYGGTLPANARIASFVPYDLLLEHADVFITNVQAGVTEEKAEIAARIAWSGAGLRLGKSHPKPSALLFAVQRVLNEPRFKRAAAKIRDEMVAHDASSEAADRLEQLASIGAIASSRRAALTQKYVRSASPE